jgi:hypothetical protein
MSDADLLMPCLREAAAAHRSALNKAAKSAADRQRAESLQRLQVGATDAGDQLEMEGYRVVGPDKANTPIHKLRVEGSLVRITAVGGAMLLVDADLHREGAVFTPYVLRGRMETEGLSMAAQSMGADSWALPRLEVVHS